MDFFVGIKGKDFVMVCSDTAASHSIISIKQDEDKIVPIDDHKVFCIAGEAGDRGPDEARRPRRTPRSLG